MDKSDANPYHFSMSPSVVSQPVPNPGYEEHLGKADRFRVLRRLIPGLALFLGIPLFLTWIGYREILLKSQHLFHESRIDLLLRWQSRLLTAGNTEVYIERLLKELENRVFASKQPANTFARFRKHIHRRFPGVFRFIWVDSDGNALPELSDTSPPRVLLKRFFLAYRLLSSGQDSPLESHQGFIRSFLGPFVPWSDEFHQKLVHACGKRANRWVYLARPRANGGFIVHISQVPRWENLGLQDRLRAGATNASRLRTTIVTNNTLVGPNFSALGAERELCRRRWRNCSETLSGVSWEDHELWGKRVVSPSATLFCRLITPEAARFDERQTRVGALLVLFWASTLLVVFQFGRTHLLPTGSVRMRLALAFLYAAGIPLFIMGITSISFLAEMRGVLENKLADTVERSLLEFDRSFPLSFSDLSRQLREAFLGHAHPSGQPLTTLPQTMARHYPDFSWDLIKIFDKNGKDLLKTHPGFTQRGGQPSMKIFSRAAVDILQKLNRGILNVADDDTETMTKLKSEAGKEEVEWFFSMLTKELWRLAPYEFGARRFLMTLFPLYDDKGGAIALTLMAWEKERLERQFVRERLQRFSRSLPESDLMAIHQDDPGLSHPATFRFFPMVQGLLPDVQSAEYGFRRKIPLSGGRRLLVTGMKCRDLSDYALLAVSQDRNIRHEIRQIGTRLGFLGALFTLLSGMIGTLLAQRFLEPVAEIDRGLQALQTGNFRFRLGNAGNDELGDLCRAFNDIIPELGDLNDARTIQENLFPRSPIDFGTWQIFGRCRSMSQVGGDYFDYFAIDGFRTAFLLGDVSGHGVSAGLVMAMAKAVVAHPLAGREPGPVLDKLQAVFMPILARKKMMTCAFGTFDCRTGTLCYANAGQSFPLVAGPAGTRELEHYGTPLGTKSRKAYVQKDFPIAEDEFILFYTDGLVEAFDLQGKVIGYSRLQAALPALHRPTARLTEAAIRGWLEKLTGNSPQEDDITILVIQRCRDNPPGAGSV
jgi:serine phosphatase RsbU (regulator of sigma subunit)